MYLLTIYLPSGKSAPRGKAPFPSGFLCTPAPSVTPDTKQRAVCWLAECTRAVTDHGRVPVNVLGSTCIRVHNARDDDLWGIRISAERSQEKEERQQEGSGLQGGGTRIERGEASALTRTWRGGECEEKAQRWPESLSCLFCSP